MRSLICFTISILLYLLTLGVNGNPLTITLPDPDTIPKLPMYEHIHTSPSLQTNPYPLTHPNLIQRRSTPRGNIYKKTLAQHKEFELNIRLFTESTTIRGELNKNLIDIETRYKNSMPKIGINEYSELRYQYLREAYHAVNAAQVQLVETLVKSGAKPFMVKYILGDFTERIEYPFYLKEAKRYVETGTEPGSVSTSKPHKLGETSPSSKVDSDTMAKEAIAVKAGKLNKILSLDRKPFIPRTRVGDHTLGNMITRVMSNEREEVL